MITSGRTAFKHAVEKALTNGAGGWTPEARLNEAALARRCRNLFWTAIAPVIGTSAATPAVQVDAAATSNAFAFPIIVTEVFQYVGDLLNLTYWEDPNHLVRLFASPSTEDTTADFFGTGNLTDVLQTLPHFRHWFSPPTDVDAIHRDGPSWANQFVPYLLQSKQTLQARWRQVGGWTLVGEWWVNHEVHFRGVTVLNPNDPYGQLCGRLKQQVCNQIKSNDPETVILDITIPEASGLFVNGITRNFTTEPQQRPLLIYGIGTNISGAQIRIQDQAVQWQFCVPGLQSNVRYLDGIEGAAVSPKMLGVPIGLAANNPEITGRDAYHIFAVPHLLEPGSSLTFELTSGLRPFGNNASPTTGYQQSYDTIGLFDPGGTVGRIALLCRSV